MGRNIDPGGGSYLTALNTGVNFTVNMTVSLWCKLNSAAGGYAFARSNGSPQRFCFGIWTNVSSYGAFLGNGAFNATHITGSVDPRIGQWDHVVFRVDSNVTMNLFVNGKQDVAPATSAYALTTSVDPLTFGGWASHGAAEAIDGKLSEVAVWNYPLSYSNITALYQGIPPTEIRPGFLRGFWPLRDGGGLERDRTIFQCHATPVLSQMADDPFGDGMLALPVASPDTTLMPLIMPSIPGIVN